MMIEFIEDLKASLMEEAPSVQLYIERKS